MSASGKLPSGGADATTVLLRAREAVRRSPSNPDMLNSLGLALHEAGVYDEAIRVFEETLRLVPSAGAVYYNLGNAVRAAGNPAASVRLYQKALALGTELPEVHNNLALAWAESGDHGRARVSYLTALQRDRRYSPAALNLAYMLIEQAQPEEATALLRAVVHEDPGCVDAHWLLSHALLMQGNYADGWKEYEWRWQKMSAAPYRRTDPSRCWAGGEIPDNRRILLYAEQGLGDAVQFIRYVPLVAACGGRVVVECHEELASLFRGIDGVSEVYSRGESIPPADFESPLLSLPGVFGTTLETVPSVIPYLYPHRSRIDFWRERCTGGPADKRIGLVWAGNPGHRNDAKRSLHPEYLSALAGTEGVRFFSLQKGEKGDARVVLPSGIVVEDLGPALRDVEDTAAVIAHMDLVISVDTVVAHVAGAMGRPVLMLVPFAPDWRWMLGTDRTPWYPTMQLFRQERAGDWGAVIGRIRQWLQA